MPEKEISSSKEPPQKPIKPVEGDQINDFFNMFEKCFKDVSDLAANAAVGELQGPIRGTAKAIVEQTGRLAAYGRKMAEPLPIGSRQQINDFIAMQAGPTIAEITATEMRASLRKGIFGKLLDWVFQNLIEIKKIGKEVLALTLEAFGIKWPKWLDKVFDVIDELNALLFFKTGEVFGIDPEETADRLSKLEIRFINETAARERYRMIQAGNLVSPSEA